MPKEVENEFVAPILREQKGQPVKLVKVELIKDKEEGLNVLEQAKKYGLPVTQMRKALKIAGITTRAKQKPKVKFTIE